MPVSSGFQLFIGIRICFLLILSCLVNCDRLVRLAYLGCYKDCNGGLRDLDSLTGIGQLGSWEVNGLIPAAKNTYMALDICTSICTYGGFGYLGMQAESYCFCGNSFGSQGLADSGNCYHRCSGNASQICGGACFNSIYSLTYLAPNAFVPSIKTYLRFYGNMTYALPTFWSVGARSESDCLGKCSADCQAAIYSQESTGTCHLLRFAAVPPSLMNVFGDFFVRV